MPKMTLVTKDTGTIPISDMQDGSLAMVVSNEFFGEIIYKNVAGWHSLTSDRWWPSDYVEQGMNGKERRAYVPNITVRLIKNGETLIVGER